MESLSSSSREVLLNQIRSNAAMIQAAGVAPELVFDDMAQNAEALLLFTDGSAEAMSRAAVNAARFGTSIADSTRMAKGLLDFESSIQKEMEISAILGQQINFNKARELIMNNDLEGAQEAVLDQIRQVGDLTHLNVMEKELLAEAANVELGTLSKMLAPQKALNQAAREQNLAVAAQFATFAGLGALILGIVGGIM